uniref:Uncharacterized protein n=1 Tax=Candidatus Kentrum sp. MB TaxID=2138164 RepID=A0A450WYQ5_9GAMM|nr:MAG: hypothetical protein BECKMB1821G_GA0114241_100176 [Candidatus Kentron sp. MB]VFK27773.1 MAG: hypothetical protein BECKMB1821I_GA0114274_100478 [Candidatus Kentron sp. MB]VFK74429.1 MAG: hypothetical protein BECKMB1821H_GA0114242_100478 [Candidatus Kentron sp. MB]
MHIPAYRDRRFRRKMTEPGILKNVHERRGKLGNFLIVLSKIFRVRDYHDH